MLLKDLFYCFLLSQIWQVWDIMAWVQFRCHCILCFSRSSSLIIAFLLQIASAFCPFRFRGFFKCSSCTARLSGNVVICSISYLLICMIQMTSSVMIFSHLQSKMRLVAWVLLVQSFIFGMILETTRMSSGSCGWDLAINGVREKKLSKFAAKKLLKIWKWKSRTSLGFRVKGNHVSTSKVPVSAVFYLYCQWIWCLEENSQQILPLRYVRLQCGTDPWLFWLRIVPHLVLSVRHEIDPSSVQLLQFLAVFCVRWQIFGLCFLDLIWCSGWTTERNACCASVRLQPNTVTESCHCPESNIREIPVC